MFTILDACLIAYFVGHYHVPTALWVFAVINELGTWMSWASVRDAAEKYLKG